MASNTLCWVPIWSRNQLGLEHVVVSDMAADSSFLAFDEDGEPFRLAYRLGWNNAGILRQRSSRHRKALIVAPCRLTLMATGVGGVHRASTSPTSTGASISTSGRRR